MIPSLNKCEHDLPEQTLNRASGGFCIGLTIYIIYADIIIEREYVNNKRIIMKESR